MKLYITALLTLLATLTLAAPITMQTVPDSTPLLDSADPFGFGYGFTINGTSYKWTNQPNITVDAISTNTLTVNGQGGVLSNNLAIVLTASDISGVLTNETTTLAQAATRGGFAGTEVITPGKISITSPDNSFSAFLGKDPAANGFLMNFSADSDSQWYIYGPTLNRISGTQDAAWSFDRTSGSYSVAATADLDAYVPITSGVSSNQTLANAAAIGTLTLNGNAVLTNSATTYCNTGIGCTLTSANRFADFVVALTGNWTVATSGLAQGYQWDLSISHSTSNQIITWPSHWKLQTAGLSYADTNTTGFTDWYTILCRGTNATSGVVVTNLFKLSGRN